jgi:HD superfamily phosphohydrolase
MTIRDLPEIQALDTRRQLIRIPPQLDVPLTPRVQALIDTPGFRRLAKISQLGLVSLVYPAAHHTRFEHSLGTYRLALLYLKQLSQDPGFRETITSPQAETLIVAALLHDIGHWPFCHPLEDLALDGLPSHETSAQAFITTDPIAGILRTQWDLEPTDITSLLSSAPDCKADALLSSILSGPIDIDKMDYLERDSLHAGVPYGNNFDQPRLIGSLCVNQHGDGLAVTEKGRTAAELMVFARYVMFSEVYWHHAVRSATAMLQRSFFELRNRLALDKLLHMTEEPFIAELARAAKDTPYNTLLAGLFGQKRQLYKRLLEFSYFQDQAVYQQLARRPYPWLVACGNALAELLNRHTSLSVLPHQLLFDAPPTKLEVEFNVEVSYQKESCYRTLADVSPVVKTLAHAQFDDYVKRVRLFVAPELLSNGLDAKTVRELLPTAIETAT